MDIDELQFEVLPQLTPEEQKKMEQEHIQRLQKFYSKTYVYSMQNWYKNLSQFTFHSLPLPLTNLQAFIITAIYQENTQILKRQKVQKAYQNLIAKVDAFLKQNFGNGCFMKLSTRSPKDAGWRFKEQQQIQRHSIQLIGKLKDSNGLDKQTVNKIYLYFLQQSKNKIKIQSGKKFIQIFTNSQRIQIDLNDLAVLKGNAFKKLYQQDYSSAEQTLIDVWGREWVDCKWKDQFRCFFYNYQLTAISQYDQRCFFQELLKQRSIIEQKAKQFFEIIKAKLQQINMSEGVMDLIIDIDNDYVRMVQINIYDHNTRASLFDWSKDEEILKNGPLELRILQQEIYISRYELLKMMGMVEKGIENILQQVIRELKFQKQWEQLL